MKKDDLLEAMEEAAVGHLKLDFPRAPHAGSYRCARLPTVARQQPSCLYPCSWRSLTLKTPQSSSNEPWIKVTVGNMAKRLRLKAIQDVWTYGSQPS